MATVSADDLCSDCVKLIASLHEKVPPKAKGWKTLPDLITSRDACRLCKFIGSSADGCWGYVETGGAPLVLYGPEGVDGTMYAHDENDGPAEASHGVDVHQRVSELNINFRLRGYQGTIIFAVWLEPCFSREDIDTDDDDYDFEYERHDFLESLSSDISRQPGLIADDDAATYSQFRSWYRQCTQCIGPCLYRPIDALDTTPDDLPTRILDIGPSPGCDIKLVETTGTDLKGPYFALSHSWGPEDKRPLRTTKDTLADHLTSISHAALPKTFQEAIKITRELGGQYLWIDSLCIIQDDATDWASEAARMGAVYQNAALTIAACAARDSTQGVFLADRSRSTPLKITTTVPATGTPIRVCLSAEPTGPREPYYSHLGSRAWVVQEWYLSPRLLFATEGGWSWKCRHIQFNERSCYYDMHEKREWEWVLERYSESALTYEKDRLVALQGMATALAGRKSGEYSYGTWTGDMPQMLFWMVREFVPEREGAIEAPSWSWAARGGSKKFWPTLYWFFQRGITLIEGDVAVHESGLLSLAAPVQKCGLSPFPMHEDHFRDDARMCPESAMLLIRAYGRENMPVHYIHNTTDNFSEAIGVAVLDQEFEELPGEIFAVALLTAPRLEADPLWSPLTDGEAPPNWKTGGDVLFHAIWRDVDGKEQPFSGEISFETRFATATQLRESPEKFEKATPDGMVYFRHRPQPLPDLVIEDHHWSLVPQAGWRRRDLAPAPTPEEGQPEVKYLGGGFTVNYVLLLVPIEGQKDQFRRIGMGVVSSKGLDSASHRQIQLA